jgi:putative glycerol-1-phosphate prenyltransferase
MSKLSPRSKIYDSLLDKIREKGAIYFILIDPDKVDSNLPRAIQIATEHGVDGFFIGGSMILTENFESCIKEVRMNTNLPVIIFPGSIYQVSELADAILFLSVITSRNPDYIVGQQIIAAPIIHRVGIEPISTAYMIVESGRTTSAEFISQSAPIPRDKPEIAIAYSLAAEYLGMKFIYLEAGSGADNCVPDDMIKAISKHVSIPIIVGGGIRKPEIARRKVEAGASIIVTGNVMETLSERKFKNLVRSFAKAIHKN